MTFLKNLIGNFSLANKKKQKFDEMDVEISEKDNVISMHIGSITVQSSMRIEDPYYLELDYTQAMSMAAIFLTNPKEILCIGLGGAAIPKFFYRLFCNSKLTIIELNSKVIRIAKQFFKLPMSKRFNIIHAEGIDYIKNDNVNYDLLISDAFEDYGLPEEFCTISYFESCRNILTEKGIFMINLWGSDAKTPLYIDRIKLVFNQQVTFAESSKPGNIIVFAFKEKNVSYSIKLLKQRIKSLEINHGLDLMLYFKRLIKNNPRGTSKQIRFH